MRTINDESSAEKSCVGLMATKSDALVCTPRQARTWTKNRRLESRLAGYAEAECRVCRKEEYQDVIEELDGEDAKYKSQGGHRG